MHRIPLWGAIIIEVLLIFLAIGGNTDEYIIDQEKIWTMIGINFVLILIPIVKRIYSNSQEKEYTNSFVSEQKNQNKNTRKRS